MDFSPLAPPRPASLAQYDVAPGVEGIQTILGVMVSQVNAAYLTPLIRAQAARAISPCAANDRRCHLAAILVWVRERVQYVDNPLHTQWLTGPLRLARAVQAGQQAFGSCADQSMYLAALAKSIGFAPSFRAIGRGTELSHVYVQIDGLDFFDSTQSYGTNMAAAPVGSVLEMEV